MGKQFGPVFLSGQFGNIRMVIDRGRGRAHLSETVSKDRILNDDAFLPTRENMSEFTGAAFAAKKLRDCLGTHVKGFSDRYLMARLNGKTRSIIARGSGPGGEREFEIGPNVGILRGIELNRHEPLDGRFKAPYTLAVNSDRNQVQMDVPIFDPAYELGRPQGTTDFRLLLSVGLLSDLLFSTQDKKYLAVDETLNGKNGLDKTPILSAQGTLSQSIQLIAQIPGAPVVPSGIYLVVAIGVEFFRTINGHSTLLGSGNAMKVVEVY